MSKLICDPAAERALLCTLVQHGKAAIIDVDDIVGPEVFYDEMNRQIYECVKFTLATKEVIDIPSLLSSAHDLGIEETLQESGNVKYIRSLFQLPTKIENARSHAEKLRKLEVARNVQRAAIEAFNDVGKLTCEETIEEIIAVGERPIFDVGIKNMSGRQEGTVLGHKDIDEYIDFLIDNPCDIAGLPLPFPTWNASVGGGLRRGTTSLIGARPKSGKTTLAVNTTIHLCQSNVPVLMLDTEMKREDIGHKVLSNLSGIPFSRIERGEIDRDAEYDKLMAAKETYKKFPFYYRGIANIKFEDVLSIIRRWIISCVGYNEHGGVNDCVVIYDYFKLQGQDMTNTDMQEYQKLGYQIADMTNFAIQYDFPVLAFVQLNREGDAKDTATAISQSDRLLWLCSSFSLLRRKSLEEITNDRANKRDMGNAKLIPLECRFGPGMHNGEFVSLLNNLELARMQEFKNGDSFEVDDKSELVVF